MVKAWLLISAGVAVVLTGCGDGNSPVDSRGSSRLVVQEVHRPAPDGMTYIEGAIQFVELTRRDESGPPVKFRLEGKPVVRTVEPGSYRVVSYTRSCSGACSTALDDPVDHCASTLAIESGERRALTVVTVVGRRCAIRSDG